MICETCGKIKKESFVTQAKFNRLETNVSRLTEESKRLTSAVLRLTKLVAQNTENIKRI